MFLAVTALLLQAVMVTAYGGDTVHVSIGNTHEAVQIENIDAPEMPPRALCPSETAEVLAARAALLAAAPPENSVLLWVGKSDRDRYGRLLT